MEAYSKSDQLEQGIAWLIETTSRVAVQKGVKLKNITCEKTQEGWTLILEGSWKQRLLRIFDSAELSLCAEDPTNQHEITQRLEKMLSYFSFYRR